MIRSLELNRIYRNNRAAVSELIHRLGVTSLLVIDQPPGAIRRLCQSLATPAVTVDHVVLFRSPFGMHDVGAARVGCA